MKRFTPSLLFVAAMLILLGVLAVLQYVQLGQISSAERERMKARLETDTRRFADDFNREIQSAYFNFKLDREFWDGKNWDEFNERYTFWLGRTKYPKLIRSFTFTEPAARRTLIYDEAQKAFVPGESSESVRRATSLIAPGVETPTVADDVPALLMPLQSSKKSALTTILMKSGGPLPTVPLGPGGEAPDAFLIIELDREILTRDLLGELNQRYFSSLSDASYNVSVIDRNGLNLFATDAVTAPDSSAKMLDLAPTDFVFYSNRELFDKSSGGVTRTVVLSSSTQRTVRDRPPAPNSNVQVRVLTEDIRPRVDETATAARIEQKGAWTLNVQHKSGSLDNFITNERRKNLAVSFGILLLLAASTVFVYLSAQRARKFAQRQVDFVSSVSHEFRTPLAVIYSASENLADGVTREPQQIARYGELIRGEGRKLSAMVEQILEFAGARAGKRRYDFQRVDVKTVIDDAINECRPLIGEKGLTIEREDGLTDEIDADRTALLGAFQNLITNAVKYSNGTKYLKITTKTEQDTAVIEFEDRGIGISARDQKKIFEPFYRSKDVVDEQIHGNGLGLSLVLETVRAHGGSIGVDSEPGQGSRFTIRLPRSK